MGWQLCTAYSSMTWFQTTTSAMVLRAVHLAHAKTAQVSGKLLLGGALGDSVDGEPLTKYKGSPS
jgi:hypothetical protein